MSNLNKWLSSALLPTLTVTVTVLFIKLRTTNKVNSSLQVDLGQSQEKMLAVEGAREMCLKQLDTRTGEMVERDETISQLTNQVG